MNLICDLVILAIIILAAVIGRMRGFVKTFFGFFGSIIGFIFASVFAGQLGKFICEKWISPAFAKYFLNSVSEKLQTVTGDIDFSVLPDSVSQLLSRFGNAPEDVRNFAAALPQGQDTAQQTAQYIVSPLANAVSYAVAFLVLFVLGALAMRIISSIFNLIAKLPGLNFSNKVLGLLCGLLWGVFIAFLLSALLSIAQPVFANSEHEWIRSFSVENTFIVRFLSSFNPLGIFLKL